MLKYRAVLTTETPGERMKQAFFLSIEQAEAWAALMLKAASPGDYVIVYLVTEVPVEIHLRADDGGVVVCPWPEYTAAAPTAPKAASR